MSQIVCDHNLVTSENCVDCYLITWMSGYLSGWSREDDIGFGSQAVVEGIRIVLVVTISQYNNDPRRVHSLK